MKKEYWRSAVNTSRRRILVTGCNGYIGSHTVKALKREGFEVHGIDWNRNSKNDVRKYVDDLMFGDANNLAKAYRYDAVVHLAGYISVEDSVKFPLDYYQNNTMGTHWQLHFNGTNGCENFIFASTAAAFDPVSPYAQSKLMAESLVKSMAKNYTIFRFFNVAGSDGEFGQVGKATHLIRVAAETAAGKRPSMNLYGTDWDTPDGTCVRDYIHVQDLVDSIVKAVYNPLNTNYECLGRGLGVSCREVIDTMKRVSGIDFTVVESPRRPGDVARLVVDKPSSLLDCKRDLYEMCLSAYKLELKR